MASFIAEIACSLFVRTVTTDMVLSTMTFVALCFDFPSECAVKGVVLFALSLYPVFVYFVEGLTLVV